MATTYTTNYNLGKQENHADKFDMDVITDNADKIDAALTELQSGIDGKQATLTTAQLAAVNSGIDSDDVDQITTNKNNISWANNYGYKNLIKRTKAEIKAANPNISWTGDTSNVFAGLTFTINDDLSITINGTTTATVVEFNIQTRTEGKSIFKQMGEYRIDGKIQEGYGIFAANRTVGSSGVRYGADVGETATFTVEQSDLSAPVGIWWGYNGSVGKVFDNVTIYPMICLSTMDRTYQQYALSNAELTAKEQTNENNILYNTAMGVKNLLRNTAVSGSRSQVTWTVNADGTVSTNGTTNANNLFIDIGTYTFENGKKYIVSGCPSGGSVNGYRITDHGGTLAINEFGGGVEITGNGSSSTIAIYANASGTNMSGLTFKPMVCTKELWEMSHDYQPYALSNAELTAKEQVNENNISLLTPQIVSTDITELAAESYADGTVCGYANSFVGLSAVWVVIRTYTLNSVKSRKMQIMEAHTGERKTRFYNGSWGAWS